MSPEDLMRTNLIALAQRYADAKGLSLATVSKEIHGNQAFLGEYLAGNMSPRVDTYFAMVEKLRENWPTGEKVEKLTDAQKTAFDLAPDQWGELPRENRRSILVLEGLQLVEVRESKAGVEQWRLSSEGRSVRRMKSMGDWPHTAPLPKLGKKVDLGRAAA